jgi:hypothetical protein
MDLEVSGWEVHLTTNRGDLPDLAMYKIAGWYIFWAKRRAKTRVTMVLMENIW